ncbi:MAG: lipoate--protein ligase family protein, partial [Acidimicrobiia bacterium]|nr:lipoate--protein ligase family protein [Acidimicrobiia bacterium]
TARVVEVTAPALVLGSTQPAVAVADRGIPVVRRRSGGGAVLVGPGELLWVEVLLPAGDRLWDDDVGRSFHWLGQVWVEALAAVGVDSAWHHGPMICTPWCRAVCFAGTGPGEVVVDGRKVVGMAQRRTRAGALFQSAALLRWDPHAMVRLLGLEPAAAPALANAAAALSVGANDLADAFLEALSRVSCA